MVRKVVSIEDEPEIAELLRVVLFSPEIELHNADTGHEGLDMVRELRPDLVVLDIMLPGGMNGWEVYDAIRADSDLKQTPIIVLSVMREKLERRQAFAGSEIDLYITKPFDTLHLRGEIERMLHQHGLWKPPAPPVARSFGMTAAELPESAAPDAPSEAGRVPVTRPVRRSPMAGRRPGKTLTAKERRAASQAARRQAGTPPRPASADGSAPSEEPPER